jgi:hypothetical protein
MGTPKKMKSGDWSESEKSASARKLARTRIESWAKTRSEETRSEDDDWPRWGILGKTQAIGEMWGKTQAIGKEGRREAKPTPRDRVRHEDEGFFVDR